MCNVGEHGRYISAWNILGCFKQFYFSSMYKHNLKIMSGLGDLVRCTLSLNFLGSGALYLCSTDTHIEKIVNNVALDFVMGRKRFYNLGGSVPQLPNTVGK